jgi:predicted MFS family arabinose efflux permease
VIIVVRMFSSFHQSPLTCQRNFEKMDDIVTSMYASAPMTTTLLSRRRRAAPLSREAREMPRCAALWGLHMGFTQGILATMVADTAPDTLRGTAFGVFSLVSSVAILLSIVIAGSLWERFGAPATFFTGAALVAAPIVMCAFAPRTAPRNANG